MSLAPRLVVVPVIRDEIGRVLLCRMSPDRGVLLGCLPADVSA